MIRRLRRRRRLQRGLKLVLPLVAAQERTHDFLAAQLVAEGVLTALKTNAGNDAQADMMGGGSAVSFTGTSTGVTATTLTMTGAGWTTDQWIGHVVVSGSRFGVVLSNTATVLTIDKWYDPAAPGGAAGSSPATGVFVLVPGNAPAYWMAITTDATAPAATDTTLASELALTGLSRKLATYSHSAGVNTFSLAAQFTNPDTTARTINKAACFNAQNAGRMVWETAVPSPPVLASATDSVTITDTVTT